MWDLPDFRPLFLSLFFCGLISRAIYLVVEELGSFPSFFNTSLELNYFHVRQNNDSSNLMFDASGHLVDSLILTSANSLFFNDLNN